MLIAKQMEIRSNIKEYFDMAYDGEVIIVPRKQGRNIVIVSEAEYNRLKQLERIGAYAGAVSEATGQPEPKNAAPLPEATTLPPKTAAPTPATGSLRRSRATDNEGVKSHNLKKLNAICSLKENWNGNGAPAFPRALTERVERLLQTLSIQPEIFPTACSTIQLEYDNSRRDHMEIEIGSGDTAEVYIVFYNGEESTDEIAVSAEAINERVNAFYG